jgi:2-polyprenyl-3-methyl-5-hydroxy-6-metoxy-1,4-benzoquinol methylase
MDGKRQMKGAVTLSRDYRAQYALIFRSVLKEAQKGMYDECTIPSYAHRNRLISWLFWKRIEAALSLAGDLKGKTVLDFGCGGGVTFRYLHEQGCSITGCEDQFPDLAREMSRHLGIDAEIAGDLFELKERRFDVIFALDVLEHIDDLGAVLDKFRELAHQHTKIVISGPTENFLYRMGRRIIGYQEQARFHERTIYDVEGDMKEGRFHPLALKTIFPGLTVFRVSSWNVNMLKTEG